MGHYEKAWQAVQARIAARPRAAGRAPETVRLLAVSQDVSAGGRSRACTRWASGRSARTTSRRRCDKRAELADLADMRMASDRPAPEQQDARSRPRRSTGSRRVDRLKIAQRLSAARAAGRRRRSTCCVQVNISGEATKSGVAPERGGRAGAATSRRCRGCAARHHGHPRADATTSRGSARSSRCCATASTHAARRGLARRHAVDGHVGRSRSGDRRGRDRGARRHGDFRPRDTLSADAMPNACAVDVHRRRQHGDALIGGLVAAGAAARDFRVVDRRRRSATRSRARFPGIARLRSADRRGARRRRRSSCSRSSRSRCARPRGARAAHRRACRSC